jgi:Tfp pilus assembly protein PilF
MTLSACVTTSSCGDDNGVRLSRTPTEHMINNGIKSYEDGNYAASMATLQSLVDNQTASKGEKVLAYKYMAFMHCMSAREKACRESFKKAIDLDPNFELRAEEVGHPRWGPVFKNVKHPPVK